MSPMTSPITSLPIVYSTVIQAQIKEKKIAPRHWPLWGEFTGDRSSDRWIPRTKSSNAENVSNAWWRHHGNSHTVSGSGLLQDNRDISNVWHTK